jgi:hypothetical protein
MNLVKQLFGKIATRNAGLVCYRDDRQARFIQLADCLARPGKEPQPGKVIHVPDFLVESPIAIDEDLRNARRSWRGGFRSWTSPHDFTFRLVAHT